MLAARAYSAEAVSGRGDAGGCGGVGGVGERGGEGGCGGGLKEGSAIHGYWVPRRGNGMGAMRFCLQSVYEVRRGLDEGVGSVFADEIFVERRGWVSGVKIPISKIGMLMLWLQHGEEF